MPRESQAPNPDEPASEHDAPEPDRYSGDLPLEEPQAGLSGDLVTDVTQLYLNDVGQHALLTPAEELEYSRATREGDFARATDDDRAQPAPRRQHRASLHASRRRAARPDRGRQPRPHPRAREVRPRARVPFHDVCDVVDPAIDRARDHEPVAHHSPSRARRQGAQRRAARAASSRDACAGREGTIPRSRTWRICSARRLPTSSACCVTRSTCCRSTRRSTASRG